MKVQANKRIHIKLVHEEQYRKMKSDYVCHMNSELYNEFCNLFGVEYKDLYWWIAKWTKEDFNLSYDFCKANDLRILRELVLDKYATLYPFIYYNNLIKVDGWMRVWISEHMGREIKRYDKQKYSKLF